MNVADVYADIVSGFSDHVDSRYLGELNVRQWSTGIDRVMTNGAFTARLPEIVRGTDV